MGTFDETALNIGVDAIAAVAVRAHLHSGDPGSGNANAITDATGTVAWDGAAGGVAALDADVDIAVPATTVSWVSYWNAGGTVRYGKDEVTAEIFAEPGTYRLKAGTTTLTFA